MELYSPPLTRARARSLGKACLIPGDTTGRKLPKTKARIFDVISTDSSSSNVEAKSNCEIKKVKLSKDELEMNGAPEGDIFDVSVKGDNELIKLAHPAIQIDSALNSLNETTSTWADRYGAIEVLRRSTLFNPALMTCHVIGEVMSALNVELDCLRSCTIRNSILCLNAVLKLHMCKEWIVSGEKASVYDEIIGKLLLKSCSGPKFLCKVISEVLVLGAKELPYARLSEALLPFTSHKNSEVCNQIYIISCENFLCQMETMITENDERAIENSLRLFQKGIVSVKPEGRDMARKALKKYADRIGFGPFNETVKLYFSEDKCSEINREIKKVHVNKCVSKVRVPLRVLKPSNRGNINDQGASACMPKSNAIPMTGGGRAKPWATKKGYNKASDLTISGAATSFTL